MSNLSNISTRCPNCDVTYLWRTYSEGRQMLYFLTLKCPKCGAIKNYAVPKEFIKETLGGFT